VTPARNLADALAQTAKLHRDTAAVMREHGGADVARGLELLATQIDISVKKCEALAWEAWFVAAGDDGPEERKVFDDFWAGMIA
jgi:hypothetical protein